MNKKKTIILLVIGILVVTTMSIGVTYSYMKNKTSGNRETEIGINNCAKITLKDNNSTINLENMYPMEEEMGLQTTPYEFTISSTCEEYTGFNLYLLTYSDNGISDDLIRYAITGKNNTVLETDLLTNKKEETSLTEKEQEEINQGVNKGYSKIYKILSNNLSLKEEKEYKLHIWVDESASNDTMGKSIKLGVMIKPYSWDGRLTEYLIKNQDRTLIYHDEKPDYEGMPNAELESGDLSYRFAGGSDTVNNYVCFNYEGEKCPEENLYRIIGLFKNEEGNYETKLIKATYATSKELGTVGNTNNYYVWNNTLDTNWKNSQLNIENLNNYFVNEYLNSEWVKIISTNNWYITKVTYSNALINNSKIVYNYEIGKNKPDSENLETKIGLIYLSDYMYSASPQFWNLVLYASIIYPDSNGNYGPEYDYRKVKNSNQSWIATNEDDLWFITLNYKATNNTVFVLGNVGFCGTNTVNSNNFVYPSFYLINNTKLSTGDGSYNNPFRLSL